MSPTVTRIDQVIPSLASRDAIGGHVMQLRDLLRDRGFESEIYYGNATPDREGDGRPITEIGGQRSAGRVLMYQLSIGSGVGDIFRDRPERKFVNYHNITPADLLEAWLPEVGEEVRWGRAQMDQLAPVTEFAIADSRYNELELVDSGYRSTEAIPLLLDLESFRAEPDAAMLKRLEADRHAGGTDLLFVGKFAPHKAQHDLVKALAAYRRLYDDRARLHIVGGAIGELYPAAVMRFAEELGVADAIDLPGSITHEELVAYYARCDAFVCLSDHEGFCVPLVEAMVHGLPIVTYDNSAVPETVGAAGLVLADKSPGRVAAAIARVVADDRLRATLAEEAARRVDGYALERTRDRFAEAIVRAAGA